MADDRHPWDLWATHRRLLTCYDRMVFKERRELKKERASEPAPVPKQVNFTRMPPNFDPPEEREVPLPPEVMGDWFKFFSGDYE